MYKMELSQAQKDAVPYRDWARDSAAAYEDGYLAAVAGVPWTPFQDCSWKEGFARAVMIHGGGPKNWETFRSTRGY